jgi:imidazole glycerol-phosphate synthase subunit HisH
VIVIVDYGMANVGSVINMLRKAGAAALATADRDMIATADKLILPGIGAFDTAMQRLRELELVDLLTDVVRTRRIPTLGICLGMQLLLEGSEEGRLPGLGWIRGRARRFSTESMGADLRVPHMGWNELSLRKVSRLFPDVHETQRFYFVHSYYVVCDDPGDVLATTSYGCEFVSATECGNVAGVQFHPEKSHRFGMRLLKAFAES